MKYSPSLLILTITALGLTACADRSFFVPWEDPKKPDYSQGGQPGSTAANSRAPLDVPPELRGDVEVPSPSEIARQDGSAAAYSAKDKKAVAGQSVALDAKVYDKSPAQVFSATVDAMTALNMPVQSVDSPSGTLTTDWIRQESATATASFGGMFGGDAVLALRYRFVVRVLRQKLEETEMTRLEIRTIGQVYTNNSWVNRPIQRKVSDELFVAVEERLAK